MGESEYPRPVFSIKWNGTKPECHEGTLLGRSGSWWHLKSKDGGVVKVNGGGRWALTIDEAWERAIVGTAWLWRISSGANQDRRRYKDFMRMIRAAMEDAHELGRMRGELDEMRRRM